MKDTAAEREIFCLHLEGVMKEVSATGCKAVHEFTPLRCDKQGDTNENRPEIIRRNFIRFS